MKKVFFSKYCNFFYKNHPPTRHIKYKMIDFAPCNKQIMANKLLCTNLERFSLIVVINLLNSFRRNELRLVRFASRSLTTSHRCIHMAEMALLRAHLENANLSNPEEVKGLLFIKPRRW